MAEVIERSVVQQFPLYYDLYVQGDGKPKPLIIALHGYGGDKGSMMRLMRRILRAGEDGACDYVIACPQGPHQHLVMPTEESPKLGYGFGWLSNFKPEESVAMHHRLISEIIETLTSAGEADAGRVFLVGFSQASGANFRFAFTHGDLVRGALWSQEPPELAGARRDLHQRVSRAVGAAEGAAARHQIGEQSLPRRVEVRHVEDR